MSPKVRKAVKDNSDGLNSQLDFQTPSLQAAIPELMRMAKKATRELNKMNRKSLSESFELAEDNIKPERKTDVQYKTIELKHNYFVNSSAIESEIARVIKNYGPETKVVSMNIVEPPKDSYRYTIIILFEIRKQV